jgi:predicted phosphodiesterase
MGNSKTKTPARIEGENLCRKFPNAPDMQLARMLYKSFDKQLKDVETARAYIRTIRGHIGNNNRKNTKDKSLFKPILRDTNSNKIPPSRIELPESFANDYSPFVIKQSRILVISDLHIPYHDNDAIRLALQYGIEKNVTCILINGDLMDMPAFSRFEKDWRMRTAGEEFEATRQFLRELRRLFPKAKIVFKEGNHDDRWERWLYNKAPEIFGDTEFRLDIRLKFGELGIDHVKDKKIIKLGKLSVLHGHEMAGGAGGVNPSRSTFLKTTSNVLVGHFHKTSNHTETTMDGNIISVNSTGCLCGLNPLYMPINRHNLGFAYVECDIESGEYQIDNLKIIKGKIYH